MVNVILNIKGRIKTLSPHAAPSTLVTVSQNIFKVFLICFLSLSASCSWFNSKTANTNENTNTAKGGTRTSPPFQTKEPEQFQAVMVYKASLGEKMPELPQQVFTIARDGVNRRVEFDRDGEKIVFLQTTNGQFILNMTKKEYGNLKLNKPADGKETGGVQTAGNPLEGMLNQVKTGATYENLGQENINGRMTRKYRVSSTETMNTGDTSNEQVYVESLIWIDESLGMPIKSETSYVGQRGGPSGVKSQMELTEIKLTPPPANIFEIPKDFKKVD